MRCQILRRNEIPNKKEIESTIIKTFASLRNQSFNDKSVEQWNAIT